MSVSAARETTIQFTGDLELSVTEVAEVNAVSPGQINVIDLTTGNNTVVIPTAGSTQATAVTIIPPPDNTSVITLKGSNSDTGIALHTTGPATITLNLTTTGIVLAVTTTTAGVRLVWS